MFLGGRMRLEHSEKTDPTFTPHLSRNSNKLQSRVWIRTISRFLLIFIGSPSTNFLKNSEIDWIQPLLRIFSEQACASLSSPWRALCPYTHYVVFGVSLACLRKFVHKCSMRKFRKFAQIQQVCACLRKFGVKQI